MQQTGLPSGSMHKRALSSGKVPTGQIKTVCKIQGVAHAGQDHSQRLMRLFGNCAPCLTVALASLAVCWVGAVSDALIAAAVLLWVGRHVAATGTLVGAHSAPLRKITLTLGAGCGLAGYFVIGRVGGDAIRCAAC
jgi:hypothetical protein